jgi:hypothetical protein
MLYKQKQTRKIQHKQGVLPYETGLPHQCNCTIECNNKSLPGEAFCQKHMEYCPITSPITGVEPDWHPSIWNKIKAFQKTHNCYSYAMNVRDPKQIAKCKGKKVCSAPYHQPGEASGYQPFTNNLPKTCPNMTMRIFGDNREVLRVSFTDKCPDNYSKIALIVDQSDDYHFLRQDSNGYWSHKPGGSKVTNLDAYDHKIWNPKLANYNYVSLDDGSTLNYDIFCSLFCVPRNRPLYLKARGGGGQSTAEPAQPLSAPARPFRALRTRRAKRD